MVKGGVGEKERAGVRVKKKRKAAVAGGGG